MGMGMGDTRHATASAEMRRSERDNVPAAQQRDGGGARSVVAAFTLARGQRRAAVPG